jgi:hypothetical protein
MLAGDIINQFGEFDEEGFGEKENDDSLMN